MSVGGNLGLTKSSLLLLLLAKDPSWQPLGLGKIRVWINC
jgi:hypothetical protein